MGVIRFVILFSLLITLNFVTSCDNQIETDDSIITVFEGKTLGIIGDSISSFMGFSPSGYCDYDGIPYNTYYPRGDVNQVDDMWWAIVASALNIRYDNIVNCSWSGSTVSGDASSINSAYAACSWRRIHDLSCRGFNPDIILCYISCNDWAKNVNIGTWVENDPLPNDDLIISLRGAYATMLSRLKCTYPKARIFCLTNLEDGKRDAIAGAPSENDNGVSVDEWNSNIILVANAFGCDVIDLHSCGITYDNIDSYTIEKVHPNKSGMALMAQTVIDNLVL